MSFVGVQCEIFLARRSDLGLAFTGAATPYLPLFVFPHKLTQPVMKADPDAIIEAFGKNEQVEKVFWALFVARVCLLLTQVVNPVTTQRVMVIFTRIGM